MKKLLIYIVLLTVLLGLCACDSGKDKKGNSAAATVASASDLTWEEIEKLADERLAAEENG